MADGADELEHLHAVNRAAHSAFVSIDEEGLVTWWNPAAERLFGWTSDEVIGLAVADVIIPEEVREAHWRGLTHFLATGEGPVLDRLIEVEALHRDGRRIPVEMTITSLRVDDTWTFHAFIRDISDRLLADTQAVEAMVKASIATALAEEYDRALADYHRLMRHRIANPLAAILGAAVTLQQHRELDPAVREQLVDAIVDQSNVLEAVTARPEKLRPEEQTLRPTPRIREERLTRNEHFFRAINARIAATERTVRDHVPFVCECSDMDCAQVVYLTRTEYAKVRANARQMAIAPGHDHTEIEDVVERFDRFWVVRKHPG